MTLSTSSFLTNNSARPSITSIKWAAAFQWPEKGTDGSDGTLSRVSA